MKKFETGQDRKGQEGTQRDGMGWDRKGWDGKGWDGKGWDSKNPLQQREGSARRGVTEAQSTMLSKEAESRDTELMSARGFCGGGGGKGQRFIENGEEKFLSPHRLPSPVKLLRATPHQCRHVSTAS
eukprot:753038-Hanusia_phi.AAC.3